MLYNVQCVYLSKAIEMGLNWMVNRGSFLEFWLVSGHFRLEVVDRKSPSISLLSSPNDSLMYLPNKCDKLFFVVAARLFACILEHGMQ